MALQDDIIAMLSQIGAAGDRATSREALGRRLYAEMGDKLSGDVLRAALRDVESARGPMGEMEDYSRVADILEKYMADVASPDEEVYISDATAGEYMTPVTAPDAAPRQPVTREPMPEVARPDLDETARESLIREMDEGLSGLLAGTPEYGISTPTPIQSGGSRGEFAGTPGTSIAPARVSDGRIPLKERLFAGQEAAGGPMSAGEQLMFASAFIPAAAIPQIGRILGMGASQIRNFLRAGDKGSEAMGQILQQRAKFMSADELAEIRQIFRASELGQRAKPTAPMRSNGRFAGTKDIGPFQMTPTEQLSRQAQQFRQGLSQPAFKQGGNIRDKIMKTYGGM